MYFIQAASNEARESTEEMLELAEEEMEATLAKLEGTERQLHRKEEEVAALIKLQSDTQAVAARNADWQKLRREGADAAQQSKQQNGIECDSSGVCDSDTQDDALAVVYSALQLHMHLG